MKSLKARKAVVAAFLGVLLVAGSIASATADTEQPDTTPAAEVTQTNTAPEPVAEVTAASDSSEPASDSTTEPASAEDELNTSSQAESQQPTTAPAAPEADATALPEQASQEPTRQTTPAEDALLVEIAQEDEPSQEATQAPAPGFDDYFRIYYGADQCTVIVERINEDVQGFQVGSREGNMTESAGFGRILIHGHPGQTHMTVEVQAWINAPSEEWTHEWSLPVALDCGDDGSKPTEGPTEPGVPGDFDHMVEVSVEGCEVVIIDRTPDRLGVELWSGHDPQGGEFIDAGQRIVLSLEPGERFQGVAAINPASYDENGIPDIPVTFAVVFIDVTVPFDCGDGGDPTPTPIPTDPADTEPLPPVVQCVPGGISFYHENPYVGVLIAAHLINGEERPIGYDYDLEPGQTFVLDTSHLPADPTVGWNVSWQNDAGDQLSGVITCGDQDPGEPTPGPSEEPTDPVDPDPSETPTEQPSATPSPTPSGQPSSSPTGTPSTGPSETPTQKLSKTPSEKSVKKVSQSPKSGTKPASVTPGLPSAGVSESSKASVPATATAAMFFVAMLAVIGIIASRGRKEMS